MKKFDKLTRNQIDHIIKKGKSYGIKIKRDTVRSNTLSFRMVAKSIGNQTMSIPTSYINGKISFEPEFSYKIILDNYDVSNFEKDIDSLYDKIDVINDFIDWLREYQNTRVK